MITQKQLKKQLKYNSISGKFSWVKSKAGVRVGSIAGCLDWHRCSIEHPVKNGGKIERNIRTNT